MMNSNLQKALLVGFVVIGVMVLAWYFGLHNYLTLAAMKENRAYLEAAVAKNYLHAVIIFIAVYMAVIAVAMPGVPPLTMIGGFLFGFIPGGIYASIAATVGTSISFLLIRYVLSGVIRGKYAQKLERFNEKITSHGVVGYLLTMQLIGVIPYFVINMLAALTDVPFKTFLWTTYVGSLPIIFIYAFAGRQLYMVESARDIFSPSIIALLVFLVLLTLMPLLVRFSRRVSDLE
jgi:uncharacterized membrane protein YdjX (TVP38/TMEM64 family)